MWVLFFEPSFRRNLYNGFEKFLIWIPVEWQTKWLKIIFVETSKKNKNVNFSPDCSGNLLKFFDWKPFLRFKRRKGWALAKILKIATESRTESVKMKKTSCFYKKNQRIVSSLILNCSQWCCKILIMFLKLKSYFCKS